MHSNACVAPMHPFMLPMHPFMPCMCEGKLLPLSLLSEGIDGEMAIDVAAGWWHTLIVLADGRCVAFGRNDDGQCNLPGDTEVATTPAVLCCIGDKFERCRQRLLVLG